MLKPLTLIMILMSVTACTTSKSRNAIVNIFVSSLDGDRMTRKKEISFVSSRSQNKADITINDRKNYQKIDGFGASFNEAGMICLNSLAKSSADSVITNLFDTVYGAGFSIMKAPIAACDFSSAGSWYSYNETAGDTLMKNFSINRDLQPNGMIPYIKMAMRHGSFRIHSTMDFPPDWMLFSLEKGQRHVRPEYYRSLARYFASYIKAYSDHGIKINYLSPLNEPDNSWYSNVNYQELSDIIKYHIVPLFIEKGINTKIQFGETCNRTEGLKKLPEQLYDTQLRRHISTINVHGYDWNKFYAVDSLHRKFPDIPVWMTEVCYAPASNNIPPGGPAKVPVYDFSDIAIWSDMIINDIKNGVSGWLYWNMILDENGGPWLFDPEHGNPDLNSQHPVVIINRKTGKVIYTGLFYGIAHFSRFVRPGASVIEASGNPENINFCAFRNIDGKIVLIVLNKGDERKYRIRWGKRILEYELPKISLTTFVWEGGNEIPVF